MIVLFNLTYSPPYSPPSCPRGASPPTVTMVSIQTTTLLTPRNNNPFLPLLGLFPGTFSLRVCIFLLRPP